MTTVNINERDVDVFVSEQEGPRYCESSEVNAEADGRYENLSTRT